MKTQFDNKTRVVSLENLKAMCDRVSGMCHRYEVTTVSRSRVHVTYSNPSEYGTDNPMTAVFPCYPSTFDGKENPAVVLDFLRVVNDSWHGEGWQAFGVLMDCPVLFRSPDSGAWETREEIEARLKDKCPKCGAEDGMPCPVCGLEVAS